MQSTPKNVSPKHTRKVLSTKKGSMPAVAFHIPGPAIAGPATPPTYYDVEFLPSPWRGGAWNGRESLYPNSKQWDCLHESGGLCGCDEPIVRLAETTREAWELMYFTKHGKWANSLRRDWLDLYDPSPYRFEPASSAYTPTSPAYTPTSPAYTPTSL